MDVYKNMTKEQYAALVPFGIACALAGYGIKVLLDKKISKVNLSVNKKEAKVVHSVDIEDIGDKKVFCRCWRSGQFPYCDGTHNKHNLASGDNVGPLIVKKKE